MVTTRTKYTGVFGAMIDDEIGCAIASGMTLERIYVELAARTREVGNALAAQHNKREAEKCAA